MHDVSDTYPIEISCTRAVHDIAHTIFDKTQVASRAFYRLHLCLPYSLLMRNESRSKRSGSAQSKEGVNKSLQSDGRSKAQKKADAKYYEACVFNRVVLCSNTNLGFLCLLSNQEKIQERNRVCMQMHRAKQK